MKRSNLNPIFAAPVVRQPQDAVAATGGIDASNSPWDPRMISGSVNASNGSPWDPRPPFAGAEACGWE